MRVFWATKCPKSSESHWMSLELSPMSLAGGEWTCCPPLQDPHSPDFGPLGRNDPYCFFDKLNTTITLQLQLQTSGFRHNKVRLATNCSVLPSANFYTSLFAQKEQQGRKQTIKRQQQTNINKADRHVHLQFNGIIIWPLLYVEVSRLWLQPFTRNVANKHGHRSSGRLRGPGPQYSAKGVHPLRAPKINYLQERKQEAQLSLTNRAMPLCKVIEVWQDFLSEYVDKKFTYICYRRLIRHKWIYYSRKNSVIYNSYKIV